MERQLWQCPRWDHVRQWAAAATGLDYADVARAAGPLTRHSLLRPPCEFRAAAAALAPPLGRLPVLEIPGGEEGPRVNAWTDRA